MRDEQHIRTMLDMFKSIPEDRRSDEEESIIDTLIYVLNPDVDDSRVTRYLSD